MPTPSHPVAHRPAAGQETKDRLLRAASTIVCDRGLAAASARVIAAEADVNQALIFYHFHTVAELIEAASNRVVDRAVAHYRPALDDAATVDDLLSIAHELHKREQVVGNVAFMAQILSGARADPIIARAGRYAVTTWTGHVQAALTRIACDSVVADLLDLTGLAQLITAELIGIELFEAVNPQGAATALSSLENLGHLVDTLNRSGPVTRRALARATRRA